MERKISNSSASFAFSISSWWQPCQLSKSGVCLQRWLMRDGSQICVCVLSLFQYPDMWVKERDQIHTFWSLCCQINTFLSAYLCHSFSVALTFFIYPVYSLSPGILLIILCNSKIFLCVCTALGRECLKVPLSLQEQEKREFPLRCDNMMTVTLFSGTPQSLFFLSTPIISSVCLPRQRLYLSPFPPSLRCVITRRQMVWVWALPPHANIRHALNLSHILMDDRVDRQFANCRTIPSALCLLPYLFDWIRGMRQIGPCEKETEKVRGVRAPQWIVLHLTVKTAVMRAVKRLSVW